LPATEQQPARVSGALVQEYGKAGAQRAVYWSSSTGAREVLDAIYTKYVAMGSDVSKARAAPRPAGVRTWQGGRRGLACDPGGIV
jgi:hypothetical protein